MFEHPFNRENLEQYLKEVAKEYRKRTGKNMPAEIILIGGAAVVINYGFRETTYDMDAVIHAASSMKEAINYVGDKFHLPNGWMNADFMKTASYTAKVSMYSQFYRRFSNIVTFRTVTGEFLIAMKLMAGRQYKYDLSDVIGVLWEHEKRGEALTLDKIKDAVSKLYDSYDVLPDASKTFIERAVTDGNYEKLYQQVRQMEAENKDILIQFQEDYPGVTNSDNVNEILASIRKKKQSGT